MQKHTTIILNFNKSLTLLKPVFTKLRRHIEKRGFV